MVLRAPLLALLATGCLVKGQVGVSAPPGTEADVAVVYSPLSSEPPQAAPEALDLSVRRTLTARGLTVNDLDATRWSEAFEKRRSPIQRLSVLAEAGDARVVCVVDTEARFYSQLNGLFRWVVDVDVAVGLSDAPVDATTVHFSVPVFLRFQHEREAEAIASAVPVIERRVDRVVGEFLGGLP